MVAVIRKMGLSRPGAKGNLVIGNPVLSRRMGIE